MNSQVKAKAGSADVLKWGVVVVLVAVGVYGNSYFAGESVLYRALALLALGVVAAFVALQTSQGVAFWALCKEARNEIRKVVWPTRQETTQTTLIVVVVVMIAAFILWLMDMGLGWLISRIIG